VNIKVDKLLDCYNNLLKKAKNDDQNYSYDDSNGDYGYDDAND